MEAPGIKHTKACRKRFSKFEEHRKKERRVEPGLSPGSPMVVPQMPVPVEEVDEGEVETTPGSAQQQPETQVEYTRRFKRKAETDREQLEERSVKILKNCFKQTWILTGFGLVVVNLCWLQAWVHLKVQRRLCLQPLLKCFLVLVTLFASIEAMSSDFMKMRLGGQDVLVWKPESIIDDQSLQELDLEQGFKGMQEEVRNLEHCKTGRIITQSELDDMKKAVPNLRLIQSRWVAADKSSERVRTRIVAKDFNRGSSARSLGFSSPTPSIESVHLVLAMAATRKMLLRALGVSHAFMHSRIAHWELVYMWS